MLTKDLLKYKANRGKITPFFVDPADEAMLDTAGQLIEIFKAGTGKSRQELSEESQFVIEAVPFDAIIARGFEKLLLDRTKFDTGADEDLPEYRKAIFQYGANLVTRQPFSTLADYQADLMQKFNQPPAELVEQLYGDLPAYQRLDSFRSISPERLLLRYNCAQVQGLLIHCYKLTVKVKKSKAAALRQLFKYLRFHQLLATIRKDGKRFVIEIDGPLSLFYKTKKYGLSLSLFFPAVLHQKQWELEAGVQFRNKKPFQLSLDQSCGLKPYSRGFWSYVPPEMQLFQRSFDDNAPGWSVQPATDFVPVEGELYCFPDYLLGHETGFEIPVELFHPWHASQVTERLEYLNQLKNRCW